MVTRGRRLAWRLLLAAVLGLPGPWAAWEDTAAAAPAADNGAVILMYHRFGEADYPSTNIRTDQFLAHLEELTSGRYRVLPLPEIVEALERNRTLPDRAIGITIDDAFASVYAEAWPRLKAAGIPFTLFVSTDAADQSLAGYMSWAQVREMAADELVTIGHHSARHGHMPKLSAAAARAEIERASRRFEEKLGAVPELFAYPYGEISLELRDIVAEAGFKAAFGQHSGALARSGDRFALPRFPLNEAYGNLERFRLVAGALPLPVEDVLPADPLIRPANNPPLFGFTVAEGIKGLSALNCFAGASEISLERLGERRIETRLSQPFKPGRQRINCTLPGPQGRWRWFGTQFYVLP